MAKCEIENCDNEGEFRGINIIICETCYEVEIPTCMHCRSGKKIDDADIGGTRCNACGLIDECHF